MVFVNCGSTARVSLQRGLNPDSSSNNDDVISGSDALLYDIMNCVTSYI